MRKVKETLTAVALAVALYQIARGFGDLARDILRDRKRKQLADEN